MTALAAVLCPLCEQAFGDEAALIEHCGGLLPEPDDEPYYCSCGAVYCSPVALATHCEARRPASRRERPRQRPRERERAARETATRLETRGKKRRRATRPRARTTTAAETTAATAGPTRTRP